MALPMQFFDPIVIGLLLCTVISIVLLIISIFCCRNIIIPNGAHAVWQLRRPYFVSYVIIIISVNMFLRSIIALLFYNSFISRAIFRELLCFLAIFGEMLCLIQRMYLLAYDLKQIKYKENKLFSKYLQRGNDIKQTLNLMSQYTQKQLKSTSPSLPTTSPTQHLSLKKHKTANIRNNIKFDVKSASFSEKMLYYNQYFGNIKIITLILCSILVFITFLPGLFVCIFNPIEDTCYNFQVYTTSILVLCLIISYLFFIICINYDTSNGCIDYKETIFNSKQKQNCETNQTMHLSNYDDYYISLEFTIILSIVALLAIIFIVLETLKYSKYINYTKHNEIDFDFILLYILILSIAGVLIIFTMIFTPYFAIKNLDKKSAFGKLKSAKYQLELQEILTHYKGFHAFTQTLVEEYSIENLMFLIELWQYKYCNYKHTPMTPVTPVIRIHEKDKDEDEDEDVSNKMEDNSVTKNSNVMDVLEEMEENESVTGNDKEYKYNLDTLFNMKVNMLLNALDDETCTSDEISISDTCTNEIIINAYNQYNEYEINRCLQILCSLPWQELAMSDSYRKYNDKYFGAVHIFNKYLCRSAFDLLNISEISLTHIESRLWCLYEYKLQSFNIGIELDEMEKKQFKLHSNFVGQLSACSISSTHSTTTKFDFVQQPQEVDTNILPKIKVAMKKEKEIKRKQKLRERLGLNIHFSSNAMFTKIENEKEFNEKLLSVFDICLPDIFNNLESALIRFKNTKQYYCCVADKLT